jgi:hypothetical protein
MNQPWKITYYHLDNGKRSSVYHHAKCRCLRQHGPYRASATTEGKRPCKYAECKA